MSTSIVIVAGREPLHRVMVPQSVAVQCVAAARQLGEFQTSCGEDSRDLSLSDDDDDDDNISNKVPQPTSGGGGGGGGGGVSACSSVELVVDAGKAITDLAIGFLLHHHDTPYNSPVFPLKPIPGAVFGDDFDNEFAAGLSGAELIELAHAATSLHCRSLAEVVGIKIFTLAARSTSEAAAAADFDLVAAVPSHHPDAFQNFMRLHPWGQQASPQAFVEWKSP